MNSLFSLFFWTALLSTVISYAWWIHLRVWLLRQDLFNIRDRLWEEVESRGMLQDPSYRETRDGINAMIRIAPLLSFQFLAGILFGGTTQVPKEAEPIPEVTKARIDAFMAIRNFMLCDTATGVILSIIAVVYRRQSMMSMQLQIWISRIFDSSDVRNLHCDPPVA